MIYKKTEQDSTEIWEFATYDIHNMPIAKGSYSDENLTIPCGKFIFYHTIIRQKKIDEHHSSIDTLYVRKRTGFYTNGQKEGTWIDYYLNGSIKSYTGYENNLYDGLYRLYDENGKILMEGNYVKDNKEGDWYIFRPDSSVKTHLKFSHNREIISEKLGEDSFNAYPGFNFIYHVYKHLIQSGIKPIYGDILVAFTVNKDGSLTEPEILMGLSPTMDASIIEAINNSPRWVPAKKGNKKIDQKVSFILKYDGTTE